MTELTKPLTRRTSARRREASKTRAIIVSLEPAATVSVRLEGTRQHFRVDLEVLYEIAVKRHEADIEKRAKQLKSGGVNIRSARAKARKELAEKLKSF